MSGDSGADRGRRFAVGAVLAAPLVAGVALSGRVRAALLGAGALVDGRVLPGPGGADFPRTLLGPAGERWTLPRAPHRIVSTYLGADEILPLLVDPERVVGVSFFADDPSISSVVGLYPASVPRLRTNVETVLALEPDLVCVAGFTDADAMRLLVAVGVPVLRWSRFDSFADVLGNVRLLGAAVGAEARAEVVTAAAEAKLAELGERLRSRTPVRALYLDPPSFTAGRGTLVDEMLTRAGALNVAAQLGIVGPDRIGIEAVLAAQPDAIVMPRYGGAPSGLDRLRADPGWREVRAVRAGRVLDVPGASVGDVSPHAIEALEALARALHPQAFVAPAAGAPAR